jgi:hypothetical protein
MATTPTEYPLSARARAIAKGLIRTKRAGSHGVVDQGILRLECLKGGFYWISLDGKGLLRGARLQGASELQATFLDTMERAAR